MVSKVFVCRADCGACCIAPSISSSIPDMPNGKPAGVACKQLDENYRCKLFGLASRPKVCQQLKPCIEMCGNSRDQALTYLHYLEYATSI